MLVVNVSGVSNFIWEIHQINASFHTLFYRFSPTFGFEKGLHFSRAFTLSLHEKT